MRTGAIGIRIGAVVVALLLCGPALLGLALVLKIVPNWFAIMTWPEDGCHGMYPRALNLAGALLALWGIAFAFVHPLVRPSMRWSRRILSLSLVFSAVGVGVAAHKSRWERFRVAVLANDPGPIHALLDTHAATMPPDTLRLFAFMAVEECDPEGVQIFLDHGIALESRGSWNETLLLRSISGSCKHGPMPRPNTARWLLAQGADMNAQDKGGNTALHLAVTHKSVEAVRMLLEHGAATDIKNVEGKTALAMAEADDHPIEHYAPIDLRTSDGSPLDPIKEFKVHEQKEIIRLLREATKSE